LSKFFFRRFANICAPGRARAASASITGIRPGSRDWMNSEGSIESRSSRHSIGPFIIRCVRRALMPSSRPSAGLPVNTAASQPR
jgi:hypothetical protein